MAGGAHRLLRMERDKLAKAHREVGDTEHGIERKMLNEAPTLPGAVHVREHAHRISARADRHLAQAQRLQNGEPRSD